MIHLLPETVGPRDSVYVTDAHLKVVHVNEAWRAFAAANGGEGLLRADWSGDLLASIGHSERARWQAIYAALLSGAIPGYDEDLTCHSPEQRRLFRTHIEPRRDDSGAIAFLVHHGAWIDPAAALPPRGSREAVNAYRAQVLAHRIDLPWLRTASSVTPLEAIGGDFLWHRVHSGGRVDLVIADVMGHGAAACELALELLRLLDLTFDPSVSVSENVARLDQRLSQQPLATASDEGLRPRFATGLYLRLDHQAQLIEVCSFAHCGPIFSKVGYVPLDHGVPIGLNFTGRRWGETALPLAEFGARFLVFTDGAHEQFNSPGTSFGVEQLAQEFRRVEALPLPEALDALLGALEDFRGPALVKDDRALLAVECAA